MATKKRELAGKRALVTGASQGIGRAIALALAGEGAAVVVAARRVKALEAVRDLIEAQGESGAAVRCDVTDPDQVAGLKSEVFGRLGGLDILVNNAGAAGSHKFLTHPDELWHRMLAVNLTSVYYVSKAFASEMVAQEWGRIINIASIASKTGGRYIAAYSASKHGVLGLTRSLALELAPHVTVNAICPGYVDTPMTEANVENITARTGLTREEVLANFVADNPQRRLISAEEVSHLAVMLARESSRGITGQAINIDGGTVMW